MHWRNLTEPGRTKEDVVRDAIVQLAEWAAAGRRVGDPVHEWVTEGRRKQYEVALARGDQWAKDMKAGYSSCGDLWHFVLMLLGCRDERIVNRGDDGGLVGWAVGRNLTRVIQTGMYCVDTQCGVPPKRGDFLHLGGLDHASILIEPAGEEWLTADYGQPYGRLRKREVTRWQGKVCLDGRPLVGRCPVSRIIPRLDHPAFVPDMMQAGIATDNPYVDDVIVPKNVLD